MINDFLKPSNLIEYLIETLNTNIFNLNLSDVIKEETDKFYESDNSKIRIEESSVSNDISQLKKELLDEADISDKDIIINVDAPIIKGDSIIDSNTLISEIKSTVEKSIASNKIKESNSNLIQKNSKVKESVVNSATRNIELPSTINIENTYYLEDDKAETSEIKPAEIVKLEAEPNTNTKLEKESSAKVTSNSTNTESILNDFKLKSETINGKDSFNPINSQSFNKEITSFSNMFDNISTLLNQVSDIVLNDNVLSKNISQNSRNNNSNLSLDNIKSENFKQYSINDNNLLDLAEINSTNDFLEENSFLNSSLNYLSSFENTIQNDDNTIEVSVNSNSPNLSNVLTELFNTSNIDNTKSDSFEKTNLNKNELMINDLKESLVQITKPNNINDLSISDILYDISNNVNTNSYDTDNSQISNNTKLPRTESSQRKISAELANSILQTPEERKLEAVTQQLSNVQNALTEVTKSQINNTNALNNIVTNNNPITNNETTISNNESTEQLKPMSSDEQNQLEQSLISNSEFYLQAIYNVLVGSGIKIKEL